MTLRKRVESLEKRAVPPMLERWHVVGVSEGQTYEGAIAAHHEPIGEDENIIFLRCVSPRIDVDGNVPFPCWTEDRA